MTTQLEQAARQALEYIIALNKSSSFWLVPGSTLNKVVNSLYAALERPAQQWTDETAQVPDHVWEQPAQDQPVAWKDEQGNVRMTIDSGEIQSSVGYVYSVHGERIKNACIRSNIPNGTPLYTRPQAREPLTDEEIKEIVQKEGFLSLQHFARAIEAAHGIHVPTERGEKK